MIVNRRDQSEHNKRLQEKLDSSIPSLYIRLSEKWLTKFVLVWCSVSLMVGLYTVDEIDLAIAAPLMTLFMYFVAMAMIMLIISFQRANPFISPNSKSIEYVAIFFGVVVFSGLFAF